MQVTLPSTPSYDKDFYWAWTPQQEAKGYSFRPVDVFFAPGTLLSGEGYGYYDPANAAHRALADRPRLSQGSAFKAAGNIYQPHCRQVSMEMNTLPLKEMLQAYEIPCQDMVDAFCHYLTHWNEGRPFILAGHSQGSILLLELLKRMFQDEKLVQQLVAAYLIGFSVTARDLDMLPFIGPAQGVDDTGVIISYNTLAADGTQGLTLLPGALCINPLNWTTGSEYAPASLNLGCVLFNAQGQQEQEIPFCTGAWIDEKLSALKADSLLSKDIDNGQFFPSGDLHRQNISLFYRNLEANAQQRVAAWQKKYSKEVLATET